MKDEKIGITIIRGQIAEYAQAVAALKGCSNEELVTVLREIANALQPEIIGKKEVKSCAACTSPKDPYYHHNYSYACKLSHPTPELPEDTDVRKILTFLKYYEPHLLKLIEKK